MRKIPELLAPVGGMPQLKAAVNNGADAVYIGGSVFNARMKADNFGDDDMKAAIDYSHERNVKVYVTLNTLLKDSEMAKAFAYTCSLYSMGADALIVQDSGLARMVSKYLPEMPMHLSTQGTLYNRSGVEFAKRQGYCRVVPAREVSLDEIRTLAEACHERDMEIEVFVHGALCMCYSGQCQMSRLLGAKDGKRCARSGNRGLCAQPCRLSYVDDSGRKGYALSPKDLCLIEDIPALCEAGVDSFKIEGRLKSPEYVAVVTRIYRKYLDIYQAGGGFEVDPEDMKALKQIFNRGDFTTGYLHGNQGDSLLSGSSPKNQGLFAGRVVSVSDVGRDVRQLIDVDTSGSDCNGITIGDGVELFETGNVVTYLEHIGKNRLRIGDFKGRIETGEEVRKVTDAEQLKAADETFENGDRGLCRRTPLQMMFTGTAGYPPLLEVREVGSYNCVMAFGEQPLENALKRKPDPERLKAQLGKLGGTPFEAGSIDVELEGDPMIPVSLVNSMRREAVEELLAGRRFNRIGPSDDEILEVLSKEIYEDSSELTDALSDAEGRKLVPLEWFMKEDFDRTDTLPYILNVSKGNLDEYIEDNFADIVSAVKECGITIGNVSWINEFLDAGVKVYGDYGLNVFNRQAAKAFAELGVEMIALSDEMSDDGEHVCLSGEKPLHGSGGPLREPEIMERVPLMVTEHPLDTEHLIDRKGAEHKVLRWYSGDKFLIF